MELSTSEFILYFNSDGTGDVDWGYKFKGLAIMDYRICVYIVHIYILMSQMSTTVTAIAEQPLIRIIESRRIKNRYEENLNIYEEHEFPGADSVTITFDERSETEKDSDKVIFYKDSSHSEYYGEEYSGGGSIWSKNRPCNFPGPAFGHPSLVIPANKFIFHFRSDQSATFVSIQHE